jgi:hypothetical protein
VLVERHGPLLADAAHEAEDALKIVLGARFQDRLRRLGSRAIVERHAPGRGGEGFDADLAQGHQPNRRHPEHELAIDPRGDAGGFRDVRDQRAQLAGIATAGRVVQSRP